MNERLSVPDRLVADNSSARGSVCLDPWSVWTLGELGLLLLSVACGGCEAGGVGCGGVGLVGLLRGVVWCVIYQRVQKSNHGYTD